MTLKYQHLIGVPFEHGKNDCYEIVRKFYKDNHNLDLTPYARPDNWWDQGLDLYNQNFYAEGFRLQTISLREVRPSDLFLMTFRSEVPNHAAVYVGDGMILHHFMGRLSAVEQYRGLWRNATTAILRHKDIVAAPEEAKPVDIMSLLPADKRRKLQEVLEQHGQTQSTVQ